MNTTGTLPSEASCIANAAADLLEKDGHTKWVLMDARGSLCFMGAIMKAHNGVDPKLLPFMSTATGRMCATIEAQALYIVNTRLRAENPDATAYWHIATWNNRAETTAEDAIALLRETAQELA